METMWRGLWSSSLSKAFHAIRGTCWRGTMTDWTLRGQGVSLIEVRCDCSAGLSAGRVWPGVVEPKA